MDAEEPRPEQPILTLVGQRVALGPLRRDLLPLYQRWMNDFEVTRTLGRAMWSLTREAWRMGELVRDEIYMDCLATEFESPLLRRLHE